MNTAIELVVPVVAAVVTGGCAAYVGLQKHLAPGARAYCVVMLSQAFWSLGYVAELLAPDLHGKIFWDDVQLPPPYLVMFGLLFFVYEYTGRSTRELRRWFWALAALPIAACAWVFSDHFHGLARASAHIVADPPYGALLYDFSTVEMLSYLEVYAVSCYAVYCLVSHAAMQTELLRRQAILASGGVVLCLFAGVPCLLGYRWFGQRDSSPLWFAIGGVCVTWALTRHQLFDLVPIARDAVIENLPDPIFVLDSKDRLLDANPAARALLGGSAKLGAAGVRSLPPWLDPGPSGAGSAPEVRELAPAGHHATYELSEAPLRGDDGKLRGRALILREVTERKRAQAVLEKEHVDLEQRVAERTSELETANASLRQQVEETRAAEEENARLQAQLYQAQKLDSMGRLAGGVAHDFNNLLTVILGNVDLARLSDSISERLNERLRDIEEASHSAASLTRQLLAFARRQIAEPRVIDLNGSVSNAEKLLARLLGEDVELHLELESELWRVRVDPSHAEQMLVNLAVNARDAMPKGGRLTLRTENSKTKPPEHLGLALASEYVVVTISDEGEGISSDILPQIFEPFFTTKPQGMGTGLGLAMVYGAMQQAFGAVDVQSSLGTGTTFQLFFPRCTDSVSVSASTAVASRPARGNEAIALVEDQILVRSTTKRQLESLGYRVLDFASAAEALPTLLREPNLAMLITDVVLAGASGRELAEELSKARPGLSILFISGYTEDVVLRHGIELGEVNFLPKPFNVAELAHAVRRALDSRARARTLRLEPGN